MAADTAEQEAGRVTVDGLPLLPTPAATLSLNLAFDELATNATEYGSLSVPHGRVEVRLAVTTARIARRR